jgi:hypothetical protein
MKLSDFLTESQMSQLSELTRRDLLKGAGIGALGGALALSDLPKSKDSRRPAEYQLTPKLIYYTTMIYMAASVRHWGDAGHPNIDKIANENEKRFKWMDWKLRAVESVSERRFTILWQSRQRGVDDADNIMQSLARKYGTNEREYLTQLALYITKWNQELAG